MSSFRRPQHEDGYHLLYLELHTESQGAHADDFVATCWLSFAKKKDGKTNGRTVWLLTTPYIANGLRTATGLGLLHIGIV